MYYQRVKSILFASLAFAVLFVLSSCGTNNERHPDANERESARLVADALGNQVEIPSHPQRVIASYLEDHLIALGVKPVAQWSVQNGQSVQDYLQDELKDVPTIPHDLPFEAVARYSPDLIIMSSASMVDGGKYEQYTKIAPTFVVSKETNDDWRQNLRAIAEIFNLKEKAEQIIQRYEEKAKSNQTLLKETIENESAAAIWLTGGNFFIVGANVSSGEVMYEDLGLAIPELVREASKEATGNWSSISLEKLATLDADHLFLINSDREDGSKIFQNPLWQNIPAVQKGNVYEFDATTSWLYSGPIANERIMDDVMECLTK